MDLVIGLSFGIASAVILAIMWRMVERIPKNRQADENRRSQPGEKGTDVSEDHASKPV